jgi:REP element-mobilizing transposase RayT
MGHPPRIPVWLPWDKSVIYFVTICVTNRKPVLAHGEAFNAFRLAASKAAILLPDHLHVIVAPTNEREAKLGNFSAALKRWMRQELKASCKWQPGCFDRLLRSGDSLHDKWLYIQENPVRAGLIQSWEDWPYRYEWNAEIGKRNACPTTPLVSAQDKSRTLACFDSDVKVFSNPQSTLHSPQS